MDIVAALSAWAPLLWWVVPLLIGSAVLNSAWFKGKIGEWSVKRAFAKHLPPQDYTVLHDVTLATKRGTTQIDHIVVSRYGLFVVETKHYAGWIFGSALARNWTQVLHRQKFTFQNPIRQNASHFRAVSEVLDIPVAELQSLIVFTGSARFKTPMPENVTIRTDGVMYIRRWRSILYAEETVEAFVDALAQGRLTPGIKTNRLHRANLEKSINDPLCPRCHAPLVLRTTKRGPQTGTQFWGCQGFPSCRYTRPH